MARTPRINTIQTTKPGRPTERVTDTLRTLTSSDYVQHLFWAFEQWQQAQTDQERNEWLFYAATHLKAAAR